MRGLCLTLAICVCLIPAVLAAGITDKVENVLAQVQVDKRSYIGEKMQLTPEEKAKFWPVYDKYQEALKELEEAYILFVWSNLEDAAIFSDDKARAVIDEYLDMETRRIELIKSFAGQFDEVLPAGKLIRYLQLENRANTFIHRNVEMIVPLMD